MFLGEFVDFGCCVGGVGEGMGGVEFECGFVFESYWVYYYDVFIVGGGCVLDCVDV